LTHSVLAIPMKRFEQPIVGFLSRDHIEAILAAPDASTWTGQRDRVMLATLYNTGARVSELIDMRVSDLTIGPTTWVRIHGKGRNYADLGNMRSSAPRRLVCLSAMGYAWRVRGVNCA
jgi:integrase/recombinase XerD